MLRYERKTPGEIIHIDIKKLGRFERPGLRITGDRTGQSRPRSGKLPGMAENSFMSPSTIIPACPLSKTNGKGERFIQTALRQWDYARAYQTSDQRAADLPI